MTDIPLGSIVELQPGRDNVYTAAHAGATAVVKERKVDSHGYPMIFVEWDKDNWRHGGEEDGWTFESHFEVIETPEDKVLDVTQQVTEAQTRRDAERCDSCGLVHEDEAEDYMNTIMDAFDEVSGSEGFIVISVTPDRVRFPGMAIYQPKVFHATLTEDARNVLEAQIVHLASVAHQRYAADLLRERKDQE
jgi:hypothetical protein